MKIEPYIKNPTDHNNSVYPTVEEFCNSHMGNEYIIAHNRDFEEYDPGQDKFFLLKDVEVLFVHASNYRPAYYLPKKWWMAAVKEWRIYRDGIHIFIEEWEDDDNE